VVLDHGYGLQSIYGHLSRIDGVQINPREWWDQHWIHDLIMSKLGGEI